MKILPLILSLISTFLILLMQKFLPERLPLFYSLPWGEAQLAQSRQLFIIPATVVAVSLFNLVIARQIHTQQILLREILSFSSIFISVILTLTILKIIFIFI